MAHSTDLDEEWLMGTVVKIIPTKGIGFIAPESALPAPFDGGKQVFFHISKKRGPELEVNGVVEFKLNTMKDPSRPEVKIVKQYGWTAPQTDRPRPRARSRSRNRVNMKMTLMEVDRSSQEDLDFGCIDDVKYLAEKWLIGTVITLKEDAKHGFITPDEPLPKPFAQKKDIFFHFTSVNGPMMNEGGVVEFQLNIKSQKDLVRPSAKIVKQLGWIIEETNHTNSTTSQDHMDVDDDDRKKSSRFKQKRKKTDTSGLYDKVEDINYDKDTKVFKSDWKSQKNKRIESMFRLQGKVDMISEEKGIGFLKPLTKLPPGYPDDKNVFFRPQYVENGGLPIKVNDVLEFTLGTQDKSRPFAQSSKVIIFSVRSASVIKDFLSELEKLLQPDILDDKLPMKESEILCHVLACEATWTCIGETITDDMINALIKILLLIDKKATSMQHAFSHILTTLSTTSFLNPWSGSLKKHIVNHVKNSPDQESLAKLKELLLSIMKNVPKKASAIATLLKPLVSSDKASMEYFLYQMLRGSIPHSLTDVDDLPWEQLPLVPSVDELICSPLENRSSLQPVKECGPYESPEEYMDVYFRLLRADCFESLKKGIRSFLGGSLDTRDMNVYHSIKLVGIHLTNQDNGLAIALQVVPLGKIKNWRTSSNLMYGNLLCLSLSNSFRDPIWATVVNRDLKLLQEKGIIIVELCTENNTASDSTIITHLSHGSGRIVAAETPTYYRAYQPILKALQSMTAEELPFQEELVKGKSSSNIPEYLKSTTTVSSTVLHEEGSGRPASELLLDAFKKDERFCILDDSQFRAIAKALLTKIGIIQGPPGTGKTFIGIKIVDLILSMSTAPDVPILVLTYKNHALDEFLKAILKKYPNSVARIGGRCKESELEMCNLSELRKNHKKSQALSKLFSQKYSESDDLKPLVKRCSSSLDKATQYSRDTLIDYATVEQILSLLHGCDWAKTQIKVPSKNGQRKLLLQDVIRNIEIASELNQDISQFLSTPVQDERYGSVRDNLHTFLDIAMKQWYPSTEIVLQVEESIGTYSHVDLDSIKLDGLEEPVIEDLQDEKDIEDLEKERMAFGNSKVLQNADIIEFRSSTKTRTEPYLFSTAAHVISKIPKAKLMNCTNLWALSPQERVLFIQCLLLEQIKDPQEEFEKYLSQYQQVCASKNELDNQYSLSILQSKKVIGMTITGASIHQNLLSALQPAIVIVEESAEVLEPQLIAALGKSVQHLILIGDHKQLRPPVESYTLRRDFRFDISMMERLINNKLPYETLQMQNRMRPEFAELLKDIYPQLRSNLTRVRQNKSPSCLEKSMFFWDHQDPEKGGRSYWNEEEANRAVRLCLFLLQQGYEPRQITILGAYQGQTALIRQKVRDEEKKYPHLFPQDNDADVKDAKEIHHQKVQVHTIDLYQGDENDIVIVSLVRSNDRNKPGFLGMLNRRCVAQSRAKCGLYFIGNTSTVCSVKHWRDLVTEMRNQGCSGTELTIICPKHPVETKVNVKSAEDITLGSFCKKPCNEDMICRQHSCPKLCQPKHSHDYCHEMVSFIFDRCGHLGRKACSKPQRDVQCKEACPKMMKCKHHLCNKKCDPPHPHEYCAERVDFTFPNCGHKSTKHCSQRLEELPPCEASVKVYHPHCGHLVEKQCHVDDHKVKCKQPCIKKLPCGHLCPNKCGQACLNVEFCKECEKIREEMERKRIEKEKEDIKEHKIRANKKLQDLKKLDVTMTIRYDLKPDGDTAGEYIRVEDRVKRYVQPMHNWMPSIKRIEKVHNPKLFNEYLEVQQEMNDPRVEERLFHGTSADAVDKIIEEGFLIPKKKGMFGCGVYFATDSSKSARDIYTKGSNMLLLCDVLLGKSLTVRTARSDMNLNYLKKNDYDSVFAKRGTQSEGGVINDEYIVYDKRQAIVRYVVHYDCSEIDANVMNQLSFLSASPTYQKHNLKAQRSFNPKDDLDINYRLAESHFLRLVSDRKLSLKLKGVQYHVNPPLISRFKKKAAEFRIKYKTNKEAHYVMAFHGTKQENISSIVKNNFDINRLSAATGNRGHYGAGIYFSEFPDISLAYGQHGQQLLLCMLLPGKSLDLTRNQIMLGQPLSQGYDSHRVEADSEGRGKELVIFSPDQILPCYVLELAPA